MQLNPRKQELAFKIVYYGPGMSGKTTNLLHLHQQAPTPRRGDLLRLDTETERTLFFDYFPLNIGKLSGYTIKLDLFTVPGQSFYQRTRRVLLENVDGVVFVADSSPAREEANLISLLDLERGLQSWGKSFDTVPLVMQWNKRDVPKALPVSVLESTLNPNKHPSFEAVALSGRGVQATQNAIVTAVLNQARNNSRAQRYA